MEQATTMLELGLQCVRDVAQAHYQVTLIEVTNAYWLETQEQIMSATITAVIVFGFCRLIKRLSQV